MSNPVVYERTIASGEASGSVEKGIQLRAGCFARQFGDSDWTKLRVGILFRLANVDQSTLYTLYGQPRFCVGFCNGTTKIPGDQTWDNWIAAVTTTTELPNTTNDHYTVYAGVTQERFNCYTGSAGYTTADLRNEVGDYRGGTITYLNSKTSSADMFFVDIEKMDTDVFQFSEFYRNSPSTNAGDYPTDVEFEAAVQSTTPSYSGYAYVAFANYVSSSHSSYPLNSVFVWWERTDHPIEIVKLYVVRLS